MEIKYSEKAAKQIRGINRGDSKSARMILGTIEAFAENPTGFFDVKLLKEKFGLFKRLRSGDYRIIFETVGNEMLVYEVKHRKEAYRD